SLTVPYREQVGAFECDRPGIDRKDGRQQSHDGLGDDGFPRARFSDDADHLVLVNIEAHLVDGVVAVHVRRETDGQVANRKERTGHDERPPESRTLRARDRPSPTELIARTVTTSAMPGKTLIHHAMRIAVREVPIM